MIPLYAEKDTIPYAEVTPRMLQAMAVLGIEHFCDCDNKVVWITGDTSEQEHERCGEPMDSLEMM